MDCANFIRSRKRQIVLNALFLGWPTDRRTFSFFLFLMADVSECLMEHLSGPILRFDSPYLCHTNFLFLGQ